MIKKPKPKTKTASAKKKPRRRATPKNAAQSKAKNISAAEWESVRKMLKTMTPTEISKKFAIPVSQIYARKRIWAFEDYKKNPRYQDPRYIAWRKYCLQRDDYTCRHCGKSKRTNPRTIFQVDHIKPYSTHPELRYDVTNGRTLCLSCHKKTPTYGYKALNYKK